MSIHENANRAGNPSSSMMFVFMMKGKGQHGFGEKAITYIQEKNIERRLGRSLGLEKYNRPTLWGHFLEMRVHDLLPNAYEYISDKTLQHPTINYWVGSPDHDNKVEDVVADTKCFEPKMFCVYVDGLMSCNGDSEKFKVLFPKEYWQLISNSQILIRKNIEAIAYMPYLSELPEIREMALNYEGVDFYKYRFIYEAPECELPYLPDGGYYKNLNIFRFEVPQKDVDALTAKMEIVGTMLDDRPKTLISLHDPSLPNTVLIDTNNQ